jgi:hypothetical protein
MTNNWKFATLIGFLMSSDDSVESVFDKEPRLGKHKKMKKINNITTAVFGILIVLTWSSCHKMSMTSGNGHVVTEKRQLVPFTEVVNETSFNVIIVEDSISEARVEAESNLIPYIRTLVNGNTLIIDIRNGGIQTTFPINIYVSSPEVNSMKLSGSGRIDAENISVEHFKVRLSGSGEIVTKVEADFIDAINSGSGDMHMVAVSENIYAEVNGSGDMCIQGTNDAGVFKVSGSGDILSYDLFQKTLDAKINGSGDMFVRVSDYLKVNIMGSGSLYYIGFPLIDVNITGSGSVINQNK